MLCQQKKLSKQILLLINRKHLQKVFIIIEYFYLFYLNVLIQEVDNFTESIKTYIEHVDKMAQQTEQEKTKV